MITMVTYGDGQHLITEIQSSFVPGLIPRTCICQVVNVGPSLLSAASFHKLLIPGLVEIEITYACNNYKLITPGYYNNL